MNQHLPSHGLEVFPPGRRSMGLLAWVAWVVVSLVVAWRVLLPVLSEPVQEEAHVQQDAVLEDVIMRMQGRLMLGAHELAAMQQEPMPEDQIIVLETGSVGQRQRAAVLAGVLIGPEAGLASLERLRKEAAEAGYSMSKLQEQTNDALTRAFTWKPSGIPRDRQAKRNDATGRRAESGSISENQLPEADRELLRSQLGWFGELLIAKTQPGQEAQWDRFQADAMFVLVILLVAFGGGGLLALLGLAGLIVGLVLLAKKRLRGLQQGNFPGLYIETFAIWLIGFMVLQQLAGWLELGLVGAIVAFYVSLLALAWLPLRGLSFSKALGEIGLSRGKGWWREIGAGFAGYCMMLPILLVGLLLTLLLVLSMDVQEGSAPFTSDPGATHPIFALLQQASVGQILLILFTASVTAPIVEEIAFRGVLYRHLRDATRQWVPFLSVVFAGMLSGFIFAAVHPQGWVAIPALGSIGFAMALAREWRSSLVAPMIMHGLNNTLVMGMVILLLG